MTKKAEYLHLKYYKVPLYRGYLVVILTNSAKKLEKYMGEDDEEPYALSYWTTFKKKQGFIMALNFDTTTKMDYNSVAHEAYHIACYIAKDSGIKLDFNNHEPMAYLVGWATEKAHDTIKHFGFKIQ